MHPYPAIHNAMWPGLVGKGPDSEPPIDPETMLDLTAQWDLHDLHRLQFFDHGDDANLRGWRNIHVTDGDHPYMQHWWVPGWQIGYEHTFIHQFADFLTGENSPPTFRDGAATDRVTGAVLQSAQSGRWEYTRAR